MRALASLIPGVLLSLLVLPEAHAGPPWELAIPGNEQDVFTPEPLAVGRSYRVTVSGTVAIPNRFYPGSLRGVEADALYYTGPDGRFDRQGGGWIRARNATDLQLIREDPALHRYVFRVTGQGSPLALRFDPPVGWRARGHLTARIEDAPEPAGLWTQVWNFAGPWRLAGVGAGIITVASFATGFLLSARRKTRRRHQASAPAGAWARQTTSGPSPREPSPTTALAVPASTNLLVLRGDSREVFTPSPLLRDRVYDLIFSGTCTFAYRRDDYPHQCDADAFHRADGYGNFSVPHESLRFDGKPLSKWVHLLEEADRELHRYRVRIDGTGSKLAIAFHPPETFYKQAAGCLSAQVELLPRETIGPIAARELAAAGKRVAEWDAKVPELRLEAEILRNWGDPGFRRQYAEKYGRDLLKPERLHHIAARHRNLFKDRAFATYLKMHHPDVFEPLDGEREAYLLAQRLDVKPAPPALPAPRPPKLTVEGFRDKFLRRIEVDADDQLARLRMVLAKKEEMEAVVEEAGLAEDQKQACLAAVQDWVAESLAPPANKEKNGGGHGPAQY
jgi:hypothetical protein